MGVTIFEHPSPNCEPRRQGVAIDTLVLHYTGMKTANDFNIAFAEQPAGTVLTTMRIDQSQMDQNADVAIHGATLTAAAYARTNGQLKTGARTLL